jgi:hypothetical protein
MLDCTELHLVGRPLSCATLVIAVPAASSVSSDRVPLSSASMLPAVCRCGAAGSSSRSVCGFSRRNCDFDDKKRATSSPVLLLSILRESPKQSWERHSFFRLGSPIRRQVCIWPRSTPADSRSLASSLGCSPRQAHSRADKVTTLRSTFDAFSFSPWVVLRAEPH